MWPFESLRKRKHQRRFNAAVIVLLGKYMFERLDAALRAKIDAEVDRELGRVPQAPAAIRAPAGWDYLGSLRALAMARLGIEPTVEGLDWSALLRPWRPWLLPWYDTRPIQVVMDFHVTDEATYAAKEFLRQKGLEIPDIDPWASVSGSASDTFLEKTRLRAHWRKQAR